MTGACPSNASGSNGSFNFSVSGVAGPFPGTFVESGSFTTSPSGHLNDFSSTFSVKNSAGTVSVTGTNSLPTSSDSDVTCQAGFGGREVVGSVGTTYRATIPGAGQDAGTATFNIDDDALGAPVQELSLSESFGSTAGVQKQCKHGGWKRFGALFKNQGDCVSFFATRGKSPPSGS